MANKREFKKYVEAVGASACDAMMATYYNVEGADKEAIEKAIVKVLGAVGEAKVNSNVAFDKGVKAFENQSDYSKAKGEFFNKLFDKINGDFAKNIDDALKIFNATIPQAVKDEYKKAVSAE